MSDEEKPDEEVVVTCPPLHASSAQITRRCLWLDSSTGESAEVTDATTAAELFDMVLEGVRRFRPTPEQVLSMVEGLKTLVLSRTRPVPVAAVSLEAVPETLSSGAVTRVEKL